MVDSDQQMAIRGAKTLKSSSLVLILALGCGAQTLAQQQSSFDLDVPPGRFSFWQLENLGSATRLEGKFEIVELRHDRNWFPLFQIRLMQGGNGLALAFVQEGGKGPLVARVDALERGERQPGRVIDSLRVERGKPFDLSLDWKDKNVLVISCNGREIGRFQLALSPTVVAVSASTGEWKGQGLTLRDSSVK